MATKDPHADQLWYIELPHERIVELIHLLEGYEGLAVPRVLSKQAGVVELLVAPDLTEDLEEFIADLSREFPIRRIARPPGVKSIADDE